MKKVEDIIKHDELIRNSILRVGEVSEVDGRRVFVKVDKNKNQSHLFFDGNILANISVNSFIEIRKGFLSIIGKVEGEKIDENKYSYQKEGYNETNKNNRFLSISLVGYIDTHEGFISGTREFPLIGNEAYVVTQDKIMMIHNLVSSGDLAINIAMTEDDIPISFPVDKLFNGHIAVFGNTGSGKSNTLAHLYQEFFNTLDNRNHDEFFKKSRFLLFDFNGEYHSNCITTKKRIYNLSTRRTQDSDKIPLLEKEILDIEFLSIIAEAQEKTQKPFLKRVLSLYNKVRVKSNAQEYFKGIVKRRVTQLLQMSDKIKAFLILDYMRNILPFDEQEDIANDLEWHNQQSHFMAYINDEKKYLQDDLKQIKNTILYKRIKKVHSPQKLDRKNNFFLLPPAYKRYSFKSSTK